ncbi:hypothetical protein [Paenibacillus sacheonensis]|nr:hypothetical protein [Paenibacillus sacheonensis]MBM7567269.1 hypothetical protein [Paenibacillus sacheonensis]
MTGRNNKPKRRGPESHPGRLEQYGERLSEESGNKPMQPDNGKSC